jgi:hypothetical protein
MKDSEENRLTWEKYCGQKCEQHSKIQDPKTSLYRSKIHFSWLIVVFIVVDRLADSDEQEEDDWDNDIE